MIITQMKTLVSRHGFAEGHLSLAILETPVSWGRPWRVRCIGAVSSRPSASKLPWSFLDAGDAPALSSSSVLIMTGIACLLSQWCCATLT